MAIARLTGQDATATSTTTSVAVAYPGACTSGNLLIACVGARGSTAHPTITSWTEAVFKTGNSNIGSTTIFYKVSDGTETTVTASRSGSTTMELAIFEYSGCATSTPFDTSASADIGGTAATTLAIGPTATLAQASELAIAAITLGGGFGSPSWASSAFNLRANLSQANGGLFTGDLIVAATTALSTTGSWTSSRTGSGAIATFKGA